MGAGATAATAIGAAGCIVEAARMVAAAASLEVFRVAASMVEATAAGDGKERAAARAPSMRPQPAHCDAVSLVESRYPEFDGKTPSQ